MDYSAEKLSKRIRSERERLGYSQALVAKCIKANRNTIRNWERGNIDAIPLGQLRILCSKEVYIPIEDNEFKNDTLKKEYEALVKEIQKLNCREEKGYFVIPMFDCEVGYLLGEEGYENRKRTTTDICKETGLSAEAVNVLRNADTDAMSRFVSFYIEIADFLGGLTTPYKFMIQMAINAFAKIVHKNAVDHGWWEEERKLPEIVALCHSELSEALEEYRNGNGIYYVKDGKPEGIAIEMLDCVIRVFDYLATLDINIGEKLWEKHTFNTERPYKHGGKVC